MAHNSHVCEPRSIFADAHVIGKNVSNFLCACGRKLCEASLTERANGKCHWLFLFQNGVRLKCQHHSRLWGLFFTGGV